MDNSCRRIIDGTKHSVLAVAIAILSLVASSCITPRRVNNLQDMTPATQIEIENRFEAVIAPYDELSINISTNGIQPELVAPFNSGSYNQGVYYNNAQRGGYLVDVNGNIQMPILGELHVAGMTRLRLQDTLTARLQRGGYVDNPFVSVRFNNFKIFYLGGGQGRVLNIQNERCTFLEALTMLGDLNPYIRRDHIAVMREVNGKMVMRYLDPRSSEVFNDPFFMLQQNDFIIADTYNAGVAWEEFTKWIGIATTIMSLGSLITSLAILKSVK